MDVDKQRKKLERIQLNIDKKVAKVKSINIAIKVMEHRKRVL